MLVLGIDVDPALIDRWREWLIPERQPYVILPERAAVLGLADRIAPLPMEFKDSFELYGLGEETTTVWLTGAEARTLPAEVRAAQPGAHRRPSRDPAETTRRVVRFVERGRRASRHGEVDDSGWRRLSGLLPGAEALAGTFPMGSGPNCFGAAMAAAGVSGAAAVWMQREPFEAWLSENAVPWGRDEDAGTVLVWRSADGAAQHAAVTLGGGWALHKPSQGWMSPTKVLSVDQVKLSARTPGRRLERHSLRGG